MQTNRSRSTSNKAVLHHLIDELTASIENDPEALREALAEEGIDQDILIQEGLQFIQTIQAQQQASKAFMKSTEIALPMSAFLSLPVGVVITDPQGHILAYNQETLNLLEVEGHHLKGKDAKDFCLQQEDAEKLRQEMKNLEKGSRHGLIENREVIIKDPHGKPAKVNLSCYFYYGTENKRQGMVILFLKDIRAQHRNLDRIIFEGCELLNIEDSILWLVDDLSHSMYDYEARVELSRGNINKEYLQEKLKINSSIADKFMKEQSPLFITDVGGRRWRMLDHYEWFQRHSWKSLLSEPIIVNDKLVGIWNLHSKKIRHFDDTELGLVDVLGKGIAAELFKPDLTNQHSIYSQIRSMHSQLKQAREQAIETYKLLKVSKQQIALAWHHGRESSKRITQPFEWANGTVFTDSVKSLKSVKEFFDGSLVELRRTMNAEIVSLFLTDREKPFLFKKIVEVDMNTLTSEETCIFRQCDPENKNGFRKDEIYRMFSSVSGRRLLDIDEELRQKLNVKLDDIILAKEIQTWLRDEAFESLGDLAMMREEDFAKVFYILPHTLEYIKGLLSRYGLEFGMQFFVKEPLGTIRIEQMIEDNELFPPGCLDRIAEIPSSRQVTHYVSVPICYEDPMHSRNVMIGFLRALNKTHRVVKSGFNSRFEIDAGFTEDDIGRLKATANKLSDFVSNFYSALNRYNEKLLNAIESGQLYSEVWEEVGQE